MPGTSTDAGNLDGCRERRRMPGTLTDAGNLDGYRARGSRFAAALARARLRGEFRQNEPETRYFFRTSSIIAVHHPWITSGSPCIPEHPPCIAVHPCASPVDPRGSPDMALGHP